MSESLQSFVAASAALQDVVARVPAHGWSQPTCCTKWDVNSVAGHVVWRINRLASYALGRGATDERALGDVLGDDPDAELAGYCAQTIAALGEPGILDQTVVTRRGPLTLDYALALTWPECVVHAWDIADAVDIDHQIDQALAGKAFAQLFQVADGLRASKQMAKPKDAAAGGDMMNTLISFTGRTPLHPRF